MIRVGFLASVLAGLLNCGAVNAADMVSLELGEFSISDESLVKPKSISVVNGQNQLNFSMKLDSLSANADGDKTEASSSMSGSFVVQQPRHMSLPTMTVQLHGLIIKSAGSTARLDLTIGNVQKTIEWKADEAAAKSFDITLNEADLKGELPVPFPITAVAIVNKSAGSGAVLLTLETINASFGQ
jgi:hypothetical protein